MQTTSNSRTITPINGTNGRFEWYQYNEDLRIIHCKDDDTFHAGSIIKALGSSKQPSDWSRNDQTKALLNGFIYNGGFSEVQLINSKKKFNNVKFIEGTYIHRLLINHFAMWVSPKYAYKISIILDDHFELQRQVEENRALEDKNKTLLQKVDEQTVEIRNLVDINRKMCNQLETIKVTLSTLVENVSELKNHVTSNKLCKYVIVLYKDEERSDEKFIVIKPFCGLKENRPKIDKSDILFEREVSCSVDSFKEALSVLEERYIVKIHYRSMTIRRSNLEDFIDEFRVELRRRSTTITDVCRRLDTINDNITVIDSKVTLIDKRLAAYDKFIANYGTDYAFVKRVLDGEVTCKNNGKIYQLQLSMKKQQPYIDINGYRLYMPLNVFHKRYL